MELTLRRTKILRVRDQWLAQYAHYPADHRFRQTGPSVAEIRASLAALDLETCSAADIDRAIGVTGWAANPCDECDEDFDVLVHFGAEPDHDATWQDLCASCLQKGLDLLVAGPMSHGKQCSGA